MSKGSSRRPESVTGNYSNGYDNIRWIHSNSRKDVIENHVAPLVNMYAYYKDIRQEYIETDREIQTGKNAA